MIKNYELYSDLTLSIRKYLKVQYYGDKENLLFIWHHKGEFFEVQFYNMTYYNDVLKNKYSKEQIEMWFLELLRVKFPESIGLSVKFVHSPIEDIDSVNTITI